MGYSNLITKAVGTVAKEVLSKTHPSVIELGNQTLKNTKSRGEIYKDLGIEPSTTLTSTKDFYTSIGFKKYVAIDVNTERDAIAMDLNLDISKAYNYTEQFDLVTNNGTGEHVFNQYTVFKNAHDLCKVGGFMIHVLPFYRWVDHGFFNYNPNLFPCLANQNGYELRELWIASSDTVYLHKLSVKDLSRNKGHRGNLKLDTWESDPMVAAVFKKVKDSKFEIPIQTLYGGDNITDGDIANRYN
jgi:hypothetical protein